MTFRFQEDDKVVLKTGEDHAEFLPAGSQGVVHCQYTTTPPAYEVTFLDSQGEQFGTIVCEDEIELAQETVNLPKRETARAA